MTQHADVTKVTKILLAANVTERDVTWVGTGETFVSVDNKWGNRQESRKNTKKFN